MTNKKEFKERRKQKRFKVREGAFAAITPDLSTVGQIINISQGGLGFRHNANPDQIDTSVEIDIFFLRHGYYIENVPSKIISHFDVDQDNPPSWLQTRQCCVQFGELSENQLFRLDNFIQLFADKRSNKDRRQFDDPNYNGPERRSGIERRSES